MRKSIRSQRAYRLFFGVLWAGVTLLSIPPAAVRAAEKAPDLSTAIIEVAKQTIPAVAHIEVSERQEVTNPLSSFGNDPFFQRFFNLPRMPKKFRREVKGLGTGMVLDDDGHILTNHHVAGGATKIEVQLSNGQRFEAKLVGTDPKTDLAVIKIPAGARPHVTFGDSDKAEVGEWVIAIGHPRGLDQTVTQGIISAKHRQGIMDPGSYQDFLQTDAAINPGNSGGPLLNLRGEVIGVNAVIASESGGSEGIGFTIPSNMAVHVSRQLIAHGKVERGWIGVSIQDLTPELAKAHKMETAKGALVADVAKGGPAEKAGLKKDDVIVAYQGKEVTDSGIFRNEVAVTPVDREVKVTVLRDGKREERTIRVESLESANKLLANDVRDRLGVEVRAVTDQEVQKYGLDDSQGVVITRVELKGPLGAAGLEVDDLILGIENQPVGGLDQFITVASELKPGQKITLFALDHRTGSVGNVQIAVR